MKRPRKIFLAFIILVALSPVALAGHTVPNDTAGPDDCVCGCPTPPTCYETGTSTVCSTPVGSQPGPECGGSRMTAQPKPDLSPLGMIGLTFALWLAIRKFI